MKGVFRSIALIVLAAALVRGAAGQASVNSAAQGAPLSALEGPFAQPASAMPCKTTIAHASPGTRLIIGAACTASLAKRAASTDERPVLHAGEALIETESGVYIVPPPSVSATTPTPGVGRPAGWPAVLSY